MKVAAWLMLAILIAACGGIVLPGATSTSKPPMMWSITQSPLFPARWPPTASTTWVRYSFAYGTNPTTLMDGAYVTQPLTRTVVHRDVTDGETTTLSTALEAVGIQGVKPLDAASSTALDKGLQVQTLCLQLQALPDEATAAELREYYRVWMNLNGAFAAQIRAEHIDFFDWIGNDP